MPKRKFLPEILTFFAGLFLWGTFFSPSGAAAAEGLQVLVLMEPQFLASPRTKSKVLESLTLVAHLLRDSDFLGLALAGETAEPVLPMANVAAGRRKLALALARRFQDRSGDGLTLQVLSRAVDLFGAEGPKTRVLIFVGQGSAAAPAPAGKGDSLPGLERLNGILAKGGVIFWSILINSPGGENQAVEAMAVTAGERVMKLPDSDHLYGAMLTLLEFLRPVQQAPLQEGVFVLDETVRTLTIVAERTRETEAVTLTLPDGRQLTSAGRHPSCRWLAHSRHDLIVFVQPPPGRWSLSGAKPQKTRIFLETPLALDCDRVPLVVGEDEVLILRAGLKGPPLNPINPAALKDAWFFAEWNLEGGARRTLLLEESPGPSGSEGFHLVRQGRFNPPHPKGEGRLRIYAVGKTFQRLLSLPVRVNDPWYHWLPPGSPENPQGLLVVRPSPNRSLQNLLGEVVFRGAGGLSGLFLRVDPGADLTLRSPGRCARDCQVRLFLQGTAADGRRVILQSARPWPQPGEASQSHSFRTAKAPAGDSSRRRPRIFSPKASRPLLWLAIGFISVGILGILVLSLFQRSSGQEEGWDSRASEESRKPKLTLKAQVEALTREKLQLEQALKEARGQISHLMAEKKSLEEKLEHLQQKSQLNIQTLEDLQKKLDEAEREAQNIRQEYMALYARSQKEKELLKKN